MVDVERFFRPGEPWSRVAIGSVLVMAVCIGVCVGIGVMFGESVRANIWLGLVTGLALVMYQLGRRHGRRESVGARPRAKSR